MKGTAAHMTVREGRLRRVKVGVSGNLSADLYWCAKHLEPVWVYDDGSWECPHSRIVGWDTEDHDLQQFPPGVGLG